MNFFKEQELIRKRTRHLVFNFYLVVCITAFSTACVLYYFGPFQENIEYGQRFYQTSYFWQFFVATFLFIFLASLFRRMQLGKGTDSIAAMAGAIPLPAKPIEISHKRLQNIVEEMSIAAGIIPPRIFLMPDEKDINAFAAGYTTHDAIIGISQGCLNKLTRDELQAVVAHEIGHIISGDMKLNLELITKLYGLMSIYDVGMTIMRPRKRTYSSGNKNKNEGAGIVIGLALAGVGLVGYVLALLLKLSISREQEFHADAKSVQFTRNPQGLAGALKKILAYKDAFRIKAQKKEQMNHMYFFYPMAFLDFLSTHPPLEVRIQKVDPSFRPQQFNRSEITQFRNMLDGNISMLVEKSFEEEEEKTSKRNYVLEDEADYYEQTLAFFYLVSGNSKGIGSGNIQYYHDKLKELPPHELIEAMDIIIGRLKSVSDIEVRNILKKIKDIILADKVILPCETLCFTLFKEVLLPSVRPKSPTRGLTSSKSDICVIMSYLASISSDTAESSLQSFEIGMKEIYPQEKFTFIPKSSLSDINQAFETIRDIIPLGKEKVFKACEVAISYDKSRSFNEAIFLKVIAQIMAIPLKEN